MLNLLNPMAMFFAKDSDSVGILLGVYLMILGISLLFSVAVYVVTSLGMSRMAKACGLSRPYLAWIPVASAYLLGQLAECGASRGGKKCMAYRKILLGLQIGVLGAAFLIFLMVVVMAVVSSSVGPSAASGLVMFGLMLLLAYLAVLGLALANTVFNYIAYWHVFRLFDENNAVIYLVVSIFFNIATPFFLIYLSGKKPALDPEPAPEENEPTYLNL